MLNHPDIQRNWTEWSEKETLNVAVAYSNPFRWRTRRELLNDFRRHMNAQPNVKLFIGELAYGDRPFEVTPESPNDVQLRTNHELWHKENILNSVIQRFPTDWKYGAWIDGDFTFTRHDWAFEAIQLLQHYDFVQLFSSYTDLSGETATSWVGQRPYRMNSSFAWNYLHQETFKKEMDRRKMEAMSGKDSYYAKLPQTKDFPFGLPPGATGGAWAFRREAFNTVGGLLDICILGSADWHMAFGLIEAVNVASEMKRCTEPYVNAVLNWQRRAAKLTRNIGCVDQHCIHHWHGSKSKRAYGERWNVLKKHDFNPLTDISRDWQGIWQLNGNKPRLRDDLRRYFIERDEDDCNLYGSEKALV